MLLGFTGGYRHRRCFLGCGKVLRLQGMSVRKKTGNTRKSEIFDFEPQL